MNWQTWLQRQMQVERAAGLRPFEPEVYAVLARRQLAPAPYRQPHTRKGTNEKVQ